MESIENVESRKIILYYANWCRHSQGFMEEWNNIKEFIDDIDLPGYTFVYEEYEESVNANIIRDSGIQAFPTIMININGLIHTYDGERNANKILIELLFKV